VTNQMATKFTVTLFVCSAVTAGQ